jgi:hypothetical protein
VAVPMSADPAQTRSRIGSVVLFSVLLPGVGHWMAGRRGQALLVFAVCQALLFGGFLLAGATQKDYGTPFSFGGTTLFFLVAPELGNFLGTQAAALLMRSVELGGVFPDALPWRHLGHVCSGASGVLALFCAAHAAGCVLSDARVRTFAARAHPGNAALATLLLPGLGHWLQGRRFKAVLFGSAIGALFLVGMALGDFADFNRQRHPYYWIGQMLLGAPGWLAGLISPHLRFERVLGYQDAGLLFTTSAGFFNVIAALDAFHRAEADGAKDDAAARAQAGGGATGEALA